MKLREIRKAHNLTVPELSRRSDVSIRTIEDLERRGDGRVSTLIKLADALEVTLDELCRGYHRHFLIYKIIQCNLSCWWLIL